jgi:hypothetical protein
MSRWIGSIRRINLFHPLLEKCKKDIFVARGVFRWEVSFSLRGELGGEVKEGTIKK